MTSVVMSSLWWATPTKCVHFFEEHLDDRLAVGVYPARGRVFSIASAPKSWWPMFMASVTPSV